MPCRRGWPPGEEPAYDVDYALVACRLHNFRPGLLFLYEVGARVWANREGIGATDDVAHVGATQPPQRTAVAH